MVGPLPRGPSKINRHRVINREINKLLNKMELPDEVYYVDIGYLFLEFDETISTNTMYDGLHLTTGGYNILTDHLSTLLYILFGKSFSS